MSFSSTWPNHATFHFRWTLLAATPNNMIIGFIITPTSQSDGVSMSASSRRSRYNLLRTLYHKASLTKWFNKRYLAAKLNNMIFAFIIPQSKSDKVIQWTLPCGNAEQYDFGFIIPQSKSSSGDSMNPSLRQRRTIRFWVHYKALQWSERRFNEPHLAVKLNNMIIAFIVTAHQSG